MRYPDLFMVLLFVLKGALLAGVGGEKCDTGEVVRPWHFTNGGGVGAGAEG